MWTRGSTILRRELSCSHWLGRHETLTWWDSTMSSLKGLTSLLFFHSISCFDETTQRQCKNSMSLETHSLFLSLEDVKGCHLSYYFWQEKGTRSAFLHQLKGKRTGELSLLATFFSLLLLLSCHSSLSSNELMGKLWRNRFLCHPSNNYSRQA